MDFDPPSDVVELLAELDGFIERVIKPLDGQDNHVHSFDHRREDARTDWERHGGFMNQTAPKCATGG